MVTIRASSGSSPSAETAACTGPRSHAALGIREIIIPPAAGVFSAVGLLLANLQSTRTMTRPMKLGQFDAPSADRVLAELKELVAEDLAALPEALSFQEYAPVPLLGAGVRAARFAARSLA